MATSYKPGLDYNQQIIAVDTKFNKYRGSSGSDGQSASNAAQFRKMYQKRRIQLLQGSSTSSEPADCECCEKIEDSIDKDDIRKNMNYLQIRTQLLRQHVRAQGISDLQSTKSFSVTTGETRAPSSGQPKKLTFSSGVGSVSSEAYDFRGFHHLSDLHQGGVSHLMFAHNSTAGVNIL